MKYIIKRRFFNKIFRVENIWGTTPETSNELIAKQFSNVKLIENGNYIVFSSMEGRYNKSYLEHCLTRLGFVFVNTSKTSACYGEHRFYVAPKYWESVKNLFDLILSEIPANQDLAFCMFENIQTFAAQKQIKYK